MMQASRRRAEGSKGTIETLQSLSARFYSLRTQVVGTLTLIGILILVYQVEILLADQMRFQTPQAMFASLPSQLKLILAAMLGPFLHQGNAYLLGNLGVLLLAGAYIEYFYAEASLYVFYLVAGYLAAWFPLFFGSVGAVGASGVTYGLQAWMAVHSISRILVMFSDIVDGKGILDRRFGYIIPLAFGAGSTVGATTLVFGGSISGAGDVTHFIGAMIGLAWGVYYAINKEDNQISIVSSIE